MFSYRDARPGRFYANRDDRLPAEPHPEPGFVCFARRLGAAAPDPANDRLDPDEALREARLDWPVHRGAVHASGPRGSAAAERYQALIRPDTDQVMSVVTRAYTPAENADVLHTALALAGRIDPWGSGLVGAVGFGQQSERTLFAVRVATLYDRTLYLFASNSHGGEGAVLFRLVEVGPEDGAVFVVDSPHATNTVAHSGNVQQKLHQLGQHSSFVEDYLKSVPAEWSELEDALWTPRHTAALTKHLWGEKPDLDPTTTGGKPLGPPRDAHRHPAYHLRLDRCSDAASAFRRVCQFLDHESEACERGDFTRDRDERLAVGAGTRIKRKAWRWIVENT
ncbi:hypothetical protein [Cellulosimicrobium cellulans]|uniref:hypothetical protein n=1 Tax=Cellulosimicrobium cellulans TaxID=1710 RepID=UPI0020CE0ECE|nr:hypothetical protein NMQ07_18140 [Cellulosimicrobium cellulans]